VRPGILKHFCAFKRKPRGTVCRTNKIRNKIKNMNLKNKLTRSRFLSKHDVDPPITVTIDEVRKEKIAVPGERPESKYCVYFKEDNVKPLILNKSNGDKIAALAFDSYETEDWSGLTVQLYLDPSVDFGGQLIGGIRVRSPQKKAAIKYVPAPLPEAEEEEIKF
jgi:hypothetical protein